MEGPTGGLSRTAFNPERPINVNKLMMVNSEQKRPPATTLFGHANNGKSSPPERSHTSSAYCCSEHKTPPMPAHGRTRVHALVLHRRPVIQSQPCYFLGSDLRLSEEKFAGESVGN